VEVINNTKIPDHVINNMLNDLGISEARYKLTIELGDCNGRGLCRRSARSFLVVLSYADHEVLAHELKHVEQHVSGLSDYMRLERELTPYKDRWHEVEAREYSKKYA
jgi:hypothetical protein